MKKKRLLLLISMMILCLMSYFSVVFAEECPYKGECTSNKLDPCTHCNSVHYGFHSLSERISCEKIDDYEHKSVWKCSLCGEKVESTGTHSLKVTSDGDSDGHYVECEFCSYKDQKSHSLVYDSSQGKTDETHGVKCSVENCGYKTTKPHTPSTYATKIDSNNHKKYCTVCDKAIIEAHDCSGTGTFVSIVTGENGLSETHKHKLTCSAYGCGYQGESTGTTKFRAYPVTSDSPAYAEKDDLHVAYCDKCNLLDYKKTEAHTKYWSMGNATDAYHECNRCRTRHVFAEAKGHATAGRHYYDAIPQTVTVGDSFDCKICGARGRLTFGMTDFVKDKLDGLPHKGEYTILGASPAMVEREFDVKDFFVYCNQYPIDIEGNVFDFKIAPDIRKYKHGTFYEHVDHLLQSVSDMDDLMQKDVNYDFLTAADDYINGRIADPVVTEKVKTDIAYFLTHYAGYRPGYINETMTRPVTETAGVLSSYLHAKAITRYNIYLFWKGYNIMTINWDKINEIGSPVGKTWLDDGKPDIKFVRKAEGHAFGTTFYDNGEAVQALPKYEIDNCGGDGANVRQYMYWCFDKGLPPGHYQIFDKTLFTGGFGETTKAKRAPMNNTALTYNAGYRNTLLFKVSAAEGGGGDPPGENPPVTIETSYTDVYARGMIGYRDVDGSRIAGDTYLPPEDKMSFFILWNALGNHYNYPLSLDWTQGAGYRIVGYEVFPGATDSPVITQTTTQITITYPDGTPDGASETTNSVVWTYDPSSDEGLGILEDCPMSAAAHAIPEGSQNVRIDIPCEPEYVNCNVIIYCEPVKYSIQHFDNLDTADAISTNMNKPNLLFKDAEENLVPNSGATGKKNFSTKAAPSLNRKWWPAYILKGYEVLSGDQVLATKTYSTETTSKLTPGDEKRYAHLTTALVDENIYYPSEYRRNKGDLDHGDEFNYDTKTEYNDKIGYAKDKTVRFQYQYPVVDVSHVKYEDTNTCLKDVDDNDLKYTVRLDSQNLVIASLNLPENDLIVTTTEGQKKFHYKIPDRALVQVLVYQKNYNDAGVPTGTASLFRAFCHRDFVPGGLDSSKLRVINDDAFLYGYYISIGSLLSDGLFTQNSDIVFSDMIFKLVYKTQYSVHVRYLDEDGNQVMPDDYRPIHDDGTADIPVPNIEDTQSRKFRDYVLEDDEPTRDKYDEEDEMIYLEDLDPENMEMIVYYYKISKDKPPEVTDPDTLELEEKPPFAYIKSNKRKDSEEETKEYVVEEAMPTEEDLYANVVTEEYILRNNFRQKERKQHLKVQLVKEYYERNNEGEVSDTAEMDIGDPFEYDFYYKYFSGAFTDMYLVDNATLYNEAIKVDSTYGNVKLTANWPAGIKPELVYEKGGTITIPQGGEDPETRSRIIQVEDSGEGTIYIKIKILDIAYSQADINVDKELDTYKNGALDQLLIKTAAISGDTLKVINVGENQNGTDLYLDGTVPMMLWHHYDKDAMMYLTDETNQYYYPIHDEFYIPRNCLYKADGITIRQDAQNKEYLTTQMDLVYLFEKNAEERLPEGESPDEVKKVYLDASLKDPINDKNLFYEKDDETKLVTKNNINVYTPIVNRVEMFDHVVDDLDNPGESENEVVGVETILEGHPRGKDNTRVLEVDKQFMIIIPHDGFHPGAETEPAFSRGYGDKIYNYEGIKSGDTTWAYEKKAFAKDKYVKFDFDVYIMGLMKDDGTIVPVHKLLEAGKWHKLSQFGNADFNGLKAEKYIFTVPNWVSDNQYKNVDVRIVARNYFSETGNAEDMDSVPASKIGTGAYNKKNEYVLEKQFGVYISGALYDLEVRTTNDVGWKGKVSSLKKAFTLSRVGTGIRYLPIGQGAQISPYALGIKLGYSVYFDVKTKGRATKDITIQPHIYYVEEDGTGLTDEITLFYQENQDSANYKKLDSSVAASISMNDTYGEVNNKENFGNEITRKTILIEDLLHANINLNDLDEIGSLQGKLTLEKAIEKLPLENLANSFTQYGYGANEESTFINDITPLITTNDYSEVKKAVQEYASGETTITKAQLQTILRSFNGHWYGEFGFPASTKVVLDSVLAAQSNPNQYRSGLEQKKGYLIVVFDDVYTTPEAGGVVSEGDTYLSYDMTDDNTQWMRETGPVTSSSEYTKVILPNGKTTLIPSIVSSSDKMIGAAMAIYEVAYTSADDLQAGGTH